MMKITPHYASISLYTPYGANNIDIFSLSIIITPGYEHMDVNSLSRIYPVLISVNVFQITACCLYIPVLNLYQVSPR